MTIDYYIGIAVGLVSALIAYVISVFKPKHDSMCDKCKKLRCKDWKGWYFCSEEGYHYFVPKYCSLYKERDDTNE